MRISDWSSDVCSSDLRSPDLTGSFGASYEGDVGANMIFGLSADAYYSDSYNASDARSPGGAQASFWRYNAGVRVGAADKRWEVALIGKNLTNKHYLLLDRKSTRLNSSH